MKILLITDYHDPTGGGAEKYFFILKNNLLHRPGINVHSLGFGPTKKVTENTTILKEFSATLARTIWRLLFNPFQYLQIRRAIKKINPDVIHLHNIKKHTIALLTAVRDYPVLHTTHDYSIICPTGWNLHKNLQPCSTGFTSACKWEHKRDINSVVYLGMVFAFLRTRSLLKKVATTFIAPSPLLANYLTQNNFNTAVYLPPFRQENDALDFSKIKLNHFLYIGQLGKHKGVDLLIDEFAEAVKSNPKLILKLAGRGRQENFLKNKVKKLGMEKNIFFVGWINSEIVYAECMAVIFPSIGLESFGLVITEALQHGRPIIGTRRGPTPWLVDDNKTGLLYDPLKSGELAEKILLLAEDKHRVERYGRAGFEKVNAFMRNEEVIEQMIMSYQEVIKKGARSTLFKSIEH